MPFPFEVPFDEVASNLDRFVDAVFGALESEFLVMPRGDGFVDFPTFEAGYERLKRETSGFREVTPEHVAEAVCIAGRGFGIRREDMKKLLIAARGKVFTLQNMHQLVAHTRLREYSLSGTG